MGSDGKPLSGPDLEKGISWQELGDGTPVLGQAFGEAVLLVRRGQSVFATGASCTHYGGPLAEGLVVGETVRCPWHHACFSLRTGEALRAPALNPLPCYEVERQDGRVRVLRKRDEAVPARVPAQAPSSVVIVGAGPAGAACTEALRREGFSGPVTLIGDEPPGPVDRPNLSKDYLAGNAPEEWIPLRPPEFYAGLDVTFILGDPAVRLDTAKQTVTLASGRALSYGALVLATGAEPRRLTVPGADRPHVFVLRTLAHSRAIIAAAGPAKRAVLVGVSFIALEVAASLRKRGLDVDLVGPDPVPLGRVLGEEVGRFVQRVHEENGERFHLGTSVAQIHADSVELQKRGAAARGPRRDGDRGHAAHGAGRGGRARGRQRLHRGRAATHQRPERLCSRRRGPAARRTRWQPGADRAFRGCRTAGTGGGPRLAGRGRTLQGRSVFLEPAPRCDPELRGSRSRAGTRSRPAASLAARDYAAFYLRGGRLLAALTVGRDQLALRVEAALEAGDEAALDRPHGGRLMLRVSAR